MTGVQVVVVAYGSAGLLDEALREVAGLPVTVIDNSSAPEVAAVCRTHAAAYRDPGRNLGFGSGVNLALRELVQQTEDDILLLNPDARFATSDIRALHSWLHAPGREDVGAASPSLRYPDGSPQRVMWPFPSPWRAWIEAIGLGRLNRQPDFAVGTALLLRNQAIREVGLFDEQFFLYAEETDWQRRAQLQGWCSTVVDDLEASHVGGATSSDEPHRRELFLAGGETYIRKWFGVLGWNNYRLAMLIGGCFRAMVLRGPRRAEAWHRACTVARGPRRVAGLTRQP